MMGFLTASLALSRGASMLHTSRNGVTRLSAMRMSTYATFKTSKGGSCRRIKLLIVLNPLLLT